MSIQFISTLRREILDSVVSIEKWASDRNLIEGSNPTAQFLKLVSEIGEIGEGVRLKSHEKVVDAFGDSFVVATIIARQLNEEVPNAIFLILSNLGGTSLSPMQKEIGVSESLGRLADFIAKGQHEKATTEIAVLLHALDYQASLLGVDMTNAAAIAYDEIKDRKGVMYNGVFIKSTDERYEGAMKELGLTV